MQVMDSDSDGRASELFDYFKVRLCSRRISCTPTRASSCATNTGDHAQVWATHAQVLCIRGFLAARKHADRILLLVEMLGTSGFPCFKAGIKTVYALRRRFALQATEPQVLHSVAPPVTAAASRCVQPGVRVRLYSACMATIV
jgi:hypothetical protein